MRPRQRRRRRHEHRQPPDGASRRTRPPRSPAGQLRAGGPEVGRGLVPRPDGRHRGPVRGHGRRPRPAPSPRQGDRLGHRRVLDAAARHRRAHRPRVGEGPDRRPDARDPAPHRALAARRRRPHPAGRALDHRRLRRAPGRRRDAHRVDHRRLRRARRGAHHLRHGPPSRGQGGRGLGGPRGRRAATSTSTTRRTRARTSTSTSSAPTAARTSSCRAPPRASRSTAWRPTG